MLTGMFRRAASLAGRGANRAYGGMAAESMGWGRAVLGDVLANTGRGARALSRNPAAASTFTGAALGGAWGAASDDTSVLGGALMGAAIGRGGYGIGRGVTAYRDLRGIGYGRGRAAADATRFVGQNSKRFIGNSYTAARNGFSALKNRFF